MLTIFLLHAPLFFPFHKLGSHLSRRNTKHLLYKIFDVMEAVMKKSVGKSVRESNFFDRKREIRRMWRSLETDNVLLLAPRRVGKTSLMFRMEETAGEHGFQAVYFSVADDNSEISFIRKLYDAIGRLKSGPNILKKIGLFLTFQEKTDKISLGKLSVEFKESAGSKWADLGKAITRALDGLEKPWLLLVGANSQAIESAYTYEEAFYDFFQIHELKGQNSINRPRWHIKRPLKSILVSHILGIFQAFSMVIFWNAMTKPLRHLNRQ